MKNTILFFVAIILSVATTNAQDKYDFKTSFVKVLENAKAYTLEVAEAMPAEDYTFKTTDSVRTFGEQMAHIGMSSMFINTKLIKGEDMPESKVTEQEVGASKEKTIALLNMSFDSIIASLKEMSDEELQEKFVLFFRPEKPEYTKLEGFEFLRDHITHHRGQAIVYLRMKGQKAPQFRAF